MKIYRTLKDLVRKAENSEPGSLASGPDRQDLVAKIGKTKEALFSRVHILIGMMSQHLVALTSMVESIDPEKNDVVYR